MRKLEAFPIEDLVTSYIVLTRCQKAEADVRADMVDLVKSGLLEIENELKIRSSEDLVSYILKVTEDEE